MFCRLRLSTETSGSPFSADRLIYQGIAESRAAKSNMLDLEIEGILFRHV